MSSTLSYIPRLWVDMVLSSLTQNLILDLEQLKREREEHERRIATEPAYALHQAEMETESHWIALYENQEQYEEEDY